MLPLLALIPGLLYTGAKFVGPIVEDHATQLVPMLESILANSPTGKKIVDAFETVVGKLDQDKKNQFQLEIDTLLGQIEVDKIEAASPSLFVSGARPFLFWGLSFALLMSVLVEPTLVWLLGCFHVVLPVPFVLDPLVVGIISSLLGIHQVTRTIEKSKK